MSTAKKDPVRYESIPKNMPQNVKIALKYQDERATKVKKALFNYIQDNNVEIVSDDQIFFEGKNLPITAFAEKVKWLFENKHKQFPIMTANEYVLLVKEINSEQHKAQELLSNNVNSQYLSESEILSFGQNEKLAFAKSLEQAKEFLKHILFKLTEVPGFIKVVAKKYYEVMDDDNNQIIIEKEILVPGFKKLEDYEDTLSNIPVRSAIHEKQETYWDVFLKSKSVIQASMTYDPHKGLYWCDEFLHYHINNYVEPEWKKQPDYYYLMKYHRNSPVTFGNLSPLLKSFLLHLFPDEKSRREVLKWCAFSTTHKLQTYLTLIGSQGIGKTIFAMNLLGYYHGKENVNVPKKIEQKFNAKNSKSTLIYFDELMMATLEDYNEMKSYTNSTLSYEEKGQPIYTTDNFANVIWSCNTKDTMSGMSRDDRRFKIIPITDKKLVGAPILDSQGNEIDKFSSNQIVAFMNSPRVKQEFVLLMLSIRDHVENNGEDLNDINTIEESDARDSILEQSRSSDFIEVIDTLRNVYNDYNPALKKFGNRPMTQEERENLGNMYEDYIPLSKVRIPRDDYYTYRVPSSVVRKVLMAKSNKHKTISNRAFNRHLENMPAKILKSYLTHGQSRDVEIRIVSTGGVDNITHDQFIYDLRPLLEDFLKNSNKKEAFKRYDDDHPENPESSEVNSGVKNPFEDE